MCAGPFGAPLEPFEDIIGQSKDNPGRIRNSITNFLKQQWQSSFSFHSTLCKEGWREILVWQKSRSFHISCRMSRLDPEESMTRVPGKRYGLSYVQGKLLLLLPPHGGAAGVKMSSATLLKRFWFTCTDSSGCGEKYYIFPGLFWNCLICILSCFWPEITNLTILCS